MSRLLLLPALVLAAKPLDNWIPQSWYFNWNPQGIDPTVSVPMTAQCESIHLTWQRASGAVPDYVPPFFLRVYTSAYPAPIVVDAGDKLNFTWAVPFAPGTQYQICMVDSNGNSGGCQAPYIVYPNNQTVLDSRTNTTTTVAPQCQNVTYPTNLLKVEGKTINGPLTQMAWADQCTDIQLNPVNGTPPYTLTVAPAYHPPSNNTFDQASFNWTVTLGWAHLFYISVVDAQGASWATGPLHSGGNGVTDCLVLGGNSISYRAVLPTRNTVPAGALAGGMIGALILGIVVGGIAFLLFTRKPKEDPVPLKRRTVASDVDPFPMSSGPLSMDVESPRPANSEFGETISRSTSPHSPRGPIPRQLSDASNHQVYVVHHDAGRAPISVYTPEGASVVELPPSYGPRSPVTETPTTPELGTSRSTRRQKGSAGSPPP